MLDEDGTYEIMYITTSGDYSRSINIVYLTEGVRKYTLRKLQESVGSIGVYLRWK